MFKIEVIGNLGANCECRSENGRTFYTFKVADTRKWTSEDGQTHEETTWVSAIMNEKLGANLAQYLTKGKKVYVRGRARLRVYSSKIDRAMKAGASCDVEDIELLGGVTESVPRELIELNTGKIHRTYKAYYLDGGEFASDSNGMPIFPEELVDRRGKLYSVQDGFIQPPKNEDEVQTEEND